MACKEIKVTLLLQHHVADNVSKLLELISSIRGSSSLWNADYLAQITNRDDYLGLVARSEDGNIVGIVILHSVPSINPLMLNEQHIFLRRLVVDPSMRMRGIGELLLSAVSKELARAAVFPCVGKVGWQTNVENSDGIDFFAKLGYFPVGQVTVCETTDKIFTMERSDFIGKFNERIRK